MTRRDHMVGVFEGVNSAYAGSWLSSGKYGCRSIDALVSGVIVSDVHVLEVTAAEPRELRQLTEAVVACSSPARGSRTMARRRRACSWRH